MPRIIRDATFSVSAKMYTSWWCIAKTDAAQDVVWNLLNLEKQDCPHLVVYAVVYTIVH